MGKPARKSSIARLDPRVREEVDKAVRSGRATIDEILSIIKSMGASASRSAVGRYVHAANKEMENYRQAQHLAKVWSEALPETGDVAQLTRQVLSSLAFKVASSLSEQDEIEGKEILFLARALRDIASSTKLGAEARRVIRAEVAEQAAAIAAKHAKKDGASKATQDEIRREILGIAA